MRTVLTKQALHSRGKKNLHKIKLSTIEFVPESFFRGRLKVIFPLKTYTISGRLCNHCYKSAKLSVHVNKLKTDINFDIYTVYVY